MPTRPVGHAQLPVDQIHANPDQPRKQFDPETMKALQRSLTQRGLINPISVVQRPEGGYVLIAGERRLRAAQALRWKAIEARIWPAQTPPEEIEILSLVENLQRQELNPLEEARAYKVLSDPPYSLPQRKIASHVGRPQSSITMSLSLLGQPEGIQSLIERSIILTGHMRLLNKITDINDRLTWAERAGKEGWSVRELDREIQKFLRKAPSVVVADPAVTPERPAGDKVTNKAVPAAENESLEGLPATSLPSSPLELLSQSEDAFTAPSQERERPSTQFDDAAGTQKGTESGRHLEDPLASCWMLAQEVAPAGASWKAIYEGLAIWSIRLELADSGDKARSDLARWLSTVGPKLLPDILPTAAPAPAPPQILEATYGNGHRLQLRWTPVGEGFTYRIYRACEEGTDFQRLGENDVSTPGAVVNSWGDGFKYLRLAVMSIDPQGRESALSQPVRFDINELNQGNTVEPLNT